MRHKLVLIAIAAILVLVALVAPQLIRASDHDDGETDTKSKNTNLTDLYVFREIDQNANAGVPAGDLVFVMNTNPRSVARQQYYFSTRAQYEFNVSRVVNNNDNPTALKDITLRFEFAEPLANGKQRITVTLIKDGQTVTCRGAGPGPDNFTTPLNIGPITNTVRCANGDRLSVFAGLREDPFFFDVEQYFRVRAGVLRIGPSVGFRNPGLDFTRGYNVDSIIVRVPLTLLQGTTATTTFDVWETISQGGAQVERLAQPAINEGLIHTNAFLNALNAIGPDCERDALNGVEPCASAAAPILAEAATFLAALGNSPAQINAIVHAFLPDVMRIDTTQPSGYAAAVNALGRPIRGRKLMDDAIDITLSVLASNLPDAFHHDNASYFGPNLGGSGHRPLMTTFPYLVQPN